MNQLLFVKKSATYLSIFLFLISCNKEDKELVISENCKAIDSPYIDTNDENTWQLMSNGNRIAYFPVKAEAELALEIIEASDAKKHCQCGNGLYTDRYGNETFKSESLILYYHLENDSTGIKWENLEDISGQDCFTVDPVKLGRSLNVITEQNKSLFTFATKKECKNALNILKHYNFNRICYIGNPNPSFMYLTRD